LLPPFEPSLRAGSTYSEDSENVSPTVCPLLLAPPKCTFAKPPTSLPKSSVTYDPAPFSVAPRGFAPLTSPPVRNTATGWTVRLAGAKLNASHGPGGAAACPAPTWTVNAANAASAPTARILDLCTLSS
jgi:hypothetical protein